MGSKEQSYKAIIRENLKNTLGSGFIPALGKHKKGKVRDNHFPIGPHEDKIIMVASDRVSCFDRILDREIPFKGSVLNLFNTWAMKNSEDVIPTASLPSPDPSIIIQKRYENVGIECVVRGYVWGSLADDYEEKGYRLKCGIPLPEGLIRYQKLDEPWFTPTTKAEKGHDADLNPQQVVEKLGSELANKLRDVSIALYQNGVALAKKAGLIFIDTKYEFGRDSNGNLFLIDESNTPDSSRFCSEEEYNLKIPQIIEAMGSKKYKTVIELTKDEEHPELKIKEGSKQFVRDVLKEGGYEEGKSLPPLTDEQIIETSWRYIDAYERITGQEFDFVKCELPTKHRILNNLIKAGYLKYYGCVVPIGASAKSESDKAHWEKLREALISEGVPFADIAYYSAHKQTQELLDYLKKMDSTSIQPLIYLTFAGGSNGLGSVVAGNTKYPVITCPVFRDKADYYINIFSSLETPSKLPLGVVVSPGNAVLFVKRILEMMKAE